MNNYLLQLLKEVKTIIIPGLGALTLTNEQTGEMMFMSYLKFDDGTLARHIAEKEGLDINDAKNISAKFVREVTARLDKGDSYDMYQFGKFMKVDGDVAFEQWQGGAAASTETVPAPQAEVIPVVVPEPIVETVIEKHIVPEEKPIEPEPKPEEITPEIENVPEESTTVKEEIPMTEQEAVAASIASALVEDAEIIEEHPVVELDDKGFHTENVPVEPVPEPEIVHETPEPINEVPEVTKPEPDVAPSPKDILAAQDAQKEKEKAAKAAVKKDTKKPVKPVTDKPKRKTSVFAYILWGIIVLVLGGGTYVAINFESLKKDFPILADLAGDSSAGEETAKAETPADTTETTEEVEPDTTNAELETTTEEEVVTQPEPAPVVEQPAPTPPPAVSKPKPSRPRASSGSNVSIGKPDPAKPFHVIGGSFSSEANANRFARELISKGQPSVIVGEFNGMYRVSIASFPTKEEALQAHGNLKSIVPQAWVFKWP